jgi:succinoglycan biosynthesis protein ExoW
MAHTNAEKHLTSTSATSATARIAVVIPYFQREAGLLSRALRSVAGQEYRPAQVVVVDDGSPRPASEEIGQDLQTALMGLTVLRQSNRGIAAARNAALAALHSDVTAVALLDSDDFWQPTHLSRAAAALTRGADFFFSNSIAEGTSEDRLGQHARLREHSEPVPDAPGIVRWRATNAALMGAACPFDLPTVVFRRSVWPQVRFSGEFRRAGEDHLTFWALLARSAVVMFCTEPTVVVGNGGLGTWRNSRFGSVAHLVRLGDEIRLRQTIMRSYPVSTHDRRTMRHAIAARRYAALYSALYLLRRRQQGAAREVARLVRSDPACALAWCAGLPKLLYRKARGAPIMTEWTGP